MADGTKIEWTDATWSPITGCSVISPGCTNCYAQRLAGTRMRHHPSREGLTQQTKAGPVWNGQVRFNEQWLAQPLHWTKPRQVFTCAHSDLFHPAVPDEWIDRIFAVMAMAPHHIFQVLTKRPERMRDYFAARQDGDPWAEAADYLADLLGMKDHPVVLEPEAIPLPNVWLGVSAEDQPRADERIPLLLDTPAAVRWVSAEPLLGSIRLPGLYPVTDDQDGVFVEGAHGCTPRLNWVAVGGESGPGARPMQRQWARSLRAQCANAGVAFFFKQWGEWIDADEWFDIIKRRPANIIDNGADTLWDPNRPLNLTDAEALARISGRPKGFEHQSDGTTMIRVGKEAAGRLLDGAEHNGMPA